MGTHVLITLDRKRELLQAEADADALRRAMTAIQDEVDLAEPHYEGRALEAINRIIANLHRVPATLGGV